MTTMYNPSHPGETLRDALAAEGWTVTEAASKLGCTRRVVRTGRRGHSDRISETTLARPLASRSMWSAASS